MSKPDIRVGDLVKATSTRYEETVTGRVTQVVAERGLFRTGSRVILFDGHDIEVLDRPLPPIPDELLDGAKSAYDKAKGFKVAPNRTALIAVINYLREHDTYNKENSK